MTSPEENCTFEPVHVKLFYRNPFAQFGQMLETVA